MCSFLLTVIESVVDGERYVEHSCTRVALNLIAHVLCPPAGFPHVSINKPVLDARTEKLVGVMVDFAVWVLAAWAPQDPLIANRAKVKSQTQLNWCRMVALQRSCECI